MPLHTTKPALTGLLERSTFGAFSGHTLAAIAVNIVPEIKDIKISAIFVLI
jgi:hypothetical protein